ncbi:MAG TPA: YdeI/OmpD-associated family protein [Candidatus Angelobacter sp.]|nr:YdeI/OmpD-associated family protein [Candidatus Angelobacter sp.]
MAKKDPRVDAYIANAADFARPILKHLRALIHAGCPEVEETIKWGFPHFESKGVLCSMAGFKGHCAFGFWKRQLVPAKSEAMGQFGRITALSDLPKDSVIIGYVKEAARQNEAGIKPAARPKKVKPAPKVPADLSMALKAIPEAEAVFSEFSNTNKREYVEWITEAKTPETRAKRLATTIEWLREGKPRNWKYMNRTATR